MNNNKNYYSHHNHLHNVDRSRNQETRCAHTFHHNHNHVCEPLPCRPRFHGAPHGFGPGLHVNAPCGHAGFGMHRPAGHAGFHGAPHDFYGRPAFGRPEFHRPGCGRPMNHRPGEFKPCGHPYGRPDFNRPGCGRPMNHRPGEFKPYGHPYGRPDFNRPGCGRPMNHRPGEFKPYGHPYGRPEFHRPGCGRPMNHRPGEFRAYGRPEFHRPGCGRPMNHRPGEFKPCGHPYGRPEFHRPGCGRPMHGRPAFGRPGFDCKPYRGPFHPTGFRKADGSLIIETKLAGFAPEDLKTVVENDRLTVTATRRTTSGEETYSCRYPLRGIDKDSVTASLKDGLLTLVLPFLKDDGKTEEKPADASGNAQSAAE